MSPSRGDRFRLSALPLLVVAGATASAAWPVAAQAPSWRELARREVVVRYAPGDSLLAVRVLDFLVDQPPLPAIPSGLPRAAVAYLAPDESTFRALAGRLPDWGAGIALPARRTLVIPVYASGRTAVGGRLAVLRHEWAHLGLHDYLGGLRVPRWFDEGYARWAEGGFDASEAWRLRLLLALGRAPSLDSLALTWPGDRASAEVAYLLAASAVAYLVEESGERGVAVLLDRWRASGSFEQALRVTYGVTSSQLEEDWRGWVKRRFGWLLVLSHSVVVWLVFGILLGALALVRRRRNRERMARLRARDPAEATPDRPAWWMGDEGPV